MTGGLRKKDPKDPDRECWPRGLGSCFVEG
jgi:hypothetical protein